MPPKTPLPGFNKGQKPPVNSVQQMLAAKLDKDSKEKPTKRLHSEVCNESNSSLDLSGIMNLHEDIKEIKSDIQTVTKAQDRCLKQFDKLEKDLIKTSDLDQLVTTIVTKLLGEFKETLIDEYEEKITKVKDDMQEKIDALSIENEDLKKKVKTLNETTANIRKDLIATTRVAKEADISSNYNEQYSRKNNIKILNFPRKMNQDLRKDFIQTCKHDLKVELEERDVVAIHRIPSQKHRIYPVIVKLFSSDVKRKVMRQKKELNGDVKFVDDVTQRNMKLINKLHDTNHFEQVWYYNCGVYGRTETGKQFKFNLYDDVNHRLNERE